MILLFMGVAAFALLYRGLHAQSGGAWQVLVGGPVVVLAVLGVVAELQHGCATSSVDWNPPDVAAADILGVWEAGPSRLALHPDGTFLLSGEGEGTERIGRACVSGTWALEHWNLRLVPSGAAVRPCLLNVVRGDEGYRIYESPGDLDGWAPWAGFRRPSASTSRASP